MRGGLAARKNSARSTSSPSHQRREPERREDQRAVRGVAGIGEVRHGQRREHAAANAEREPRARFLLEIAEQQRRRALERPVLLVGEV